MKWIRYRFFVVLYISNVQPFFGVLLCFMFSLTFGSMKYVWLTLHPQLWQLTECCGWVVRSLTLYIIWKAPNVVLSQETDHLSEDLHNFTQNLQANVRYYLKIGCDYFLPHLSNSSLTMFRPFNILQLMWWNVFR